MKTIAVLGWATRVSKKNPPKIDYTGLMVKNSLVNWESESAKTRRIVGALKQFNETDSNILLGVYGVTPDKLNRIKSYKELPSLAVTNADIFSRPSSLADKVKDFFWGRFIRNI